MKRPGCGVPMTMIAPTMTIPWIAFVPGHQRRVQQRRHLRDDLEADESARTRIVSSVTS